MKGRKLVTTLSDDALQRRIARFVGDVRIPKAINGDGNVCLGSNLGSVRKDNQDRALVVWADYPENPERNFTLSVLSDGMGGLMNGDEAATIALSVFVSRVLRTPRITPPERLRNAAILSNDAVFERFGGRGGATLSAAFLGKNGSKLGVNIGDSRIYAITAARDLVQLSRDDTLAGVLGEQHSSNGNHNRLVQFMGMGEGIEPNIIDIDPEVVETLLITSDGVHNSPIGTLTQIVRRARSEADIVRKLLSLSDLLGGQDNGTAIALGTLTASQPGDGEQGLNLTFLSVNGRLEVWIPVLSDDARYERPRTLLANNAESGTPPKAGAAGAFERLKAGPSERNRNKKRKSRGSDARSGKLSTNEENVLPLHDEKLTPILDVKFPSSE